MLQSRHEVGAVAESTKQEQGEPAAKSLQLVLPGLQLQQLARGDVAKVEGVEEENQPLAGGAKVVDADVEDLVLLVADRRE